MKNRILIFLFLSAVIPTISTAQTTSVIRGAIRYDGPDVEPVFHSVSDEFSSCDSEIPDETLIVDGESSGLKNAIVYLEGIDVTQTWRTEDVVVLDQKGCVFDPHVVILPVGQALKVRNSDGILHNFHTAPENNRPVNLAMPKTMNEMEVAGRRFRFPDFTRVSCDIHNWMSAVIVVAAHPYYAVTDENGEFTLKDVPPGTYELVVWHESLEGESKPITVGPGETETATFDLKPDD